MICSQQPVRLPESCLHLQNVVYLVFEDNRDCCVVRAGSSGERLQHFRLHLIVVRRVFEQVGFTASTHNNHSRI